ncbi:glycosyltransferase family 2 protein [Cupriavidus sp. MP-37]|uniref:glycosyltransferase family 2 protein n=1 Tax=Cupriavidus sp. MP-37 TaxID=2884455 RepID=UPI001D0B07D4|nr:glycosyltransferase family 2 protein [Cupriavidus sp. MP-37]UDM53338.1 glycosyltransferase family 2 protein [Cupriavidus sp. MP-37]
MKIFNTSRSAKFAETNVAKIADIQSTPMRFPLPDGGASCNVKVDEAYRLGNTCVVVGWATQPVKLALLANGTQLTTRVVQVERPDVAAHFAMQSDTMLGFVLVAESVDVLANVELAISVHPGPNVVPVWSQPLKFASLATDVESKRQAFGPAVGLLAQTCEPLSQEWLDIIRLAPTSNLPCRGAKGFLEIAAAPEQSKEGIVVGWIVQTPQAVVWLEDDKGQVYSLDSAYRRFRQDVHDAVAHEFGAFSQNAGFIARVRGLSPNGTVLLKAVDENGVHVLGSVRCQAISMDPVAAARWIFGVATPIEDMHRRVAVVDEPVLNPLIAHRQAMWRNLPVVTRVLGKLPVQPRVSVIVPLYGRSDFVEHQLIEFCNDPWFQQHAELIYVLDDPKLAESFPAQAEGLFRVYRQPMRWVWGNVNRGFSGANNLGVTYATATQLIFLNSDAFPQRPGWAQQLCDVLDSRPDIGAVGPRLVFADGSIQHAGMEFLRREELGVWTNHHAQMGLDPVLDPRRELSIVPSVTGACVAIRSVDLERIGGWDTGYLIGDFEDSDLCLKLRDQGLDIAYLPSVQLTHLERQSFKLLGQGDFRTRVVIYNAVRHQSRWSSLIEASATPA